MKKIVVIVLLGPILIVAYAVLRQPNPGGIAIVAGLLFALLFVALPRYGRSPREKLRGGLEGAPTDPGERRTYLRTFLLACGVGGLAHGLWRMVEPDAVRATGRWAWLHNLFLDVFGPVGPALLSLCLSAILLFYAYRLRHRSQP